MTYTIDTARKASSPYLNRPCRSLETFLVTRIAEAFANGWATEDVEQLLAEIDRARRVVKPRRADTTNAGE